MYKASLLLVLAWALLTGCSKQPDSGSTPTPTPADEYYIRATADGVTYNLTSSASVGNTYSNSIGADGKPTTSLGNLGAYSSKYSEDNQFLSVVTERAFSGKPETMRITFGNFTPNRFDRYQVDMLKQDGGTISVTKIDNKMAEGTFTMVLYAGTKKLTLSNGTFRLPFK